MASPARWPNRAAGRRLPPPRRLNLGGEAHDSGGRYACLPRPEGPGGRSGKKEAIPHARPTGKPAVGPSRRRTARRQRPLTAAALIANPLLIRGCQAPGPGPKLMRPLEPLISHQLVGFAAGLPLSVLPAWRSHKMRVREQGSEVARQKRASSSSGWREQTKRRDSAQNCCRELHGGGA